MLDERPDDLRAKYYGAEQDPRSTFGPHRAISYGMNRVIGMQNEQLRERVMNMNQSPVFMAPAGTPFDDLPNRWAELGYVTTDGFDLDQIDAEAWHRANPPLTTRTVQQFTFTMARRNRRQFIQVISGLYRLPGEKPLIHNGKKPR